MILHHTHTHTILAALERNYLSIYLSISATSRAATVPDLPKISSCRFFTMKPSSSCKQAHPAAALSQSTNPPPKEPPPPQKTTTTTTNPVKEQTSTS